MPHKNPQEAREYQRKYQLNYRHSYIQKGINKKDLLKTQKCLFCENEFEPFNAQQKFCNTKCKAKNWLKEHPRILIKKRTKKRIKKQTKKRIKKRIKKQPRDYYMPKKYGINESQYQELFKQQNGKCAICGETETRKNKQGNLWNLPIDHDHKTKKIRGLLCHRCNLVLGFVKDNPTLLQEMIKYLNKNGKKKIQN